MIGLDTNVLLRWIVRDEPAQAALADEVVASLTPERPGFVTQVSVLELFWVLRTTYRYPRERCLDVLEMLLRAEELEFDDGESVWEAVVHARRGADLPDGLIAETLRLYGAGESVTFDREAADRFGWRRLA